MTLRRDFIRTTALAALSPAFSLETADAVARGALAPGMAGLDLETAQPSGKPFRMTRPWYERLIARLQQQLAARGLKGLIVRDGGTLNYLTGIFLTNTERPAWLWVPSEGKPALFGPGLDRDMYADWWIDDREWYFDYPHTGPFGVVGTSAGPPADLLQWMLNGVARRAGATGRFGIDAEPTPSLLRRMRAVLPRVAFVHAGDIVEQMQRHKTPEELALIRVAIDYNDQMLHFARTVIAERGLGMYDSAVRRMTEERGEELLFGELQLTGRPHVGVGIMVGCDVIRAGAATAYPHPNQYFRKKIARGDAIQISSVFRVGGYGGEGYRALHVAPIPELGKKMWEVHTEMTLAQAEYSKPGVECREVAEKVLVIARKANMLDYVYHRPAHGVGMEGHQGPYIALGDATVLEEGMMFSNEPGLYNPQGGYGYNHSNTLVITATGATRLNRTPLTTKFCWLKI